MVCVNSKDPRCRVFVYLPFSEESFDVQRKRFHVWAIAYSEKIVNTKNAREVSKVDPHGLEQLLLGKWICSSKLENLPGLSLTRWEICQVFSFTRPKETYFIGVRVKKEVGEEKGSFLLSLSSTSLPVSYPTHFDSLQRFDFFGIEHGGYSWAETFAGHVGKCSYRNFCRAVSRPNRLPLLLRGCDTHFIEAIKLVSTESIK